MLKKIGTHAGICSELTALYERKNHDYGDSFGKSFKEYGMAMPCIRLEDKLNRLKALTRSGNQQVSDESIDDTLMDLANYAIMTLVERKIAENEKRRCNNCKYGGLSITEEPCSTCDNQNDKWEAETNASY
jgi:hypothetical protein